MNPAQNWYESKECEGEGVRYPPFFSFFLLVSSFLPFYFFP